MYATISNTNTHDIELPILVRLLVKILDDEQMPPWQPLFLPAPTYMFPTQTQKPRRTSDTGPRKSDTGTIIGGLCHAFVYVEPNKHHTLLVKSRHHDQSNITRISRAATCRNRASPLAFCAVAQNCDQAPERKQWKWRDAGRR
jgi:hypothetical protein